ncbi:MAG: Asp-tRNA(Asn)/Glu-tRNA(Gln) amidotransferase subunit GatC [bacterium]
MDKLEIQHIAKLSRIALTEKEAKKYEAELARILGYVKKLQDINTDGVATCDGGTQDLENIWRNDSEKLKINSEKLSEDLVNMAPEKYNGQVRVKKIL